MTNTTPETVAQWMLSRLNETGLLYQIDAVGGIQARFGPEFHYTNEAVSLCIKPAVLRRFNHISADTVVWDRRLIGWRRREPDDQLGRRQP
jgi:Family of unknown function (DUF6953)